jgi:hypothetical protein
VEQQYAVVGVLEDFNVTLTVFEHYIPRFFRGASNVYYGKYFFILLILLRVLVIDKYSSKNMLTGEMGLHKVNQNAFKPTVSEAVKDIVRQNFTREIEFYQFCRQRLYRQRLALNL